MNKESLKIYSVASVWPKWQIILPLECREDLKIDIWNIFNIWRIENIAFVIFKEDSENNESFASLPEKDEKNILKKDLLKKCFFGNFETKIKVWTKFQFVIPVEISVYADRSFTFILKTPPASDLLKKAAKTQKGAANSKKDVAGKITKAQLKEIAETKMPDLNAGSVEAAMNIIAGTARSMGIKIEE